MCETQRQSSQAEQSQPEPDNMAAIVCTKARLHKPGQPTECPTNWSGTKPWFQAPAWILASLSIPAGMEREEQHLYHFLRIPKEIKEAYRY